MPDPCAGHFCDGCEVCRAGTCCKRDRQFTKPKWKKQPAPTSGQAV